MRLDCTGIPLCYYNTTIIVPLLIDSDTTEITIHLPTLPTLQRSWSEALSQSKDVSASEVQDKDARLKNALRDLESTKKDFERAEKDLVRAKEGLQEEREALSVSRARTNELHKLGVDMERELTAMLEGDWSIRLNRVSFC